MIASSQSRQLPAAKNAKSKMRHSRQLAVAKTAKSKMWHSSQQLAAATHRKGRRARNACMIADLDLLVGGVAENDVQHCARHATYGQGMFQNCLRCVAIRCQKEIARVRPWAIARSYHLGGAGEWVVVFAPLGGG